MVKLHKRFAYTHKGTDHYKRIFTILDDAMQRLDWRNGIEVEQKVHDNQLIFTTRRNGKEAIF